MRNRLSKLISFFLAMIMLVTCAVVGTLPTGAATLTEAQFAEKLADAKKLYPDGSRKYEWSINGTVVGWECHGYARWLSWYVWGVDFANGNGKNWGLKKSSSSSTYIKELVPGDVVRYRSSTSNSYNHTIFITSISGDTINFTDCNSDGNSTIRWNNRSISKSTLEKYLKIKLYGDEAATYGYIAHYSPNTIGTLHTLTVKFNANGGVIDPRPQYKLTTDGYGLRLRKSASTSADTLIVIPDSTVITADDSKTAGGYEWVKVTYKDSDSGKSYTGWCAVSSSSEVFATPTGYYLNSSVVYRVDKSTAFTESWVYGTTRQNGLTNNTTFRLSRDGYKFVGWCTTADGSTRIFDQNDNTIKGEDIYPDLKNADKTITLYAIWEKIPATLSKVEIVTLPSKTEYLIGESLNTDGLSLKLTYSDNSTVTVTDGFACSGFDSAVEGIKTVTVDYAGYKNTFDVEISAPQLTIIGMVIEYGDDVKRDYMLGEEFDPTGMNFVIKYSDMSVERIPVTSEHITKFDPNTEGEQVVEITYDDSVFNFVVTVRNPEPNCIPGDTNNDGTVDLNDYTYLMRILNGASVTIYPGADVDKNNLITLNDLTKLARILNGETTN